MRCKYCNAEVAPYARFCTTCGAKVDMNMNCREIRIFSQFDMYSEVRGRTKAILLFYIFFPLSMVLCLWGFLDSSNSPLLKVLLLPAFFAVGWALWYSLTERKYKPGLYTRESKDSERRIVTYGGIAGIIIAILFVFFIYMEEQRLGSWVAAAIPAILGLVCLVNYTRKSYQLHEDVDTAALSYMENMVGVDMGERIQAAYQNFDPSNSDSLRDGANIMVVTDRKIYYSSLDYGRWSFVKKNICDIAKLGCLEDDKYSVYDYTENKEYFKLVFSDGTSIMLHMKTISKLSSNPKLFRRKFFEVLDAVILGTINEYRITDQ